MTRRRLRRDDALENYRAEWRRSRKKILLAKALARCREQGVAEPKWLHEALYRLGRTLVTRLKKTGRCTDLVKDASIYDTVEDYRKSGMTQDKAFERTAQEYACELANGAQKGRRTTDDYCHTVKSTWLRVQKRIVKVDPKKNFGLDWFFKKKYRTGHDKNAKLLNEPVPSYLRRTKNN
jgi:hypothetical protein